jgi:hypothetical protein
MILKQDDEMRWLSRDVLPADEAHRIPALYPRGTYGGIPGVGAGE